MWPKYHIKEMLIKILAFLSFLRQKFTTTKSEVVHSYETYHIIAAKIHFIQTSVKVQVSNDLHGLSTEICVRSDPHLLP